MSEVKMRPMNEEEYLAWKEPSFKRYVAEKVRKNGIDEASATEIAKGDFERSMPDGLKTEGSFFYTLYDDDSENLGMLWWGLRGAEDNRLAWLLEIWLPESARRKGVGKQAMKLFEIDAREKGAKRMGLHVFGDNTSAITLYEKSGFETTDLVMHKTL